MWAGELTSAAVQSLAYDAQKQGATGVERISALGSYGKYPGNFYKGLVHLFGRPKEAPPIDWVEIPLKSGASEPHPFI